MKGYKAFDKDLRCKGFQYEVGKTYEMKEKPVICRKGFHFCKNIADVYKYYPMSNKTRICKVEAFGDIESDGYDKYCTNKIFIVSEIFDEKIKILQNMALQHRGLKTGITTQGVTTQGITTQDSLTQTLKN